MTHEELQGRLLDLACGELSPREAREVEGHAATCEACRAELAAMRGTRQVMSALPVEPAPEQGERVLVAAAREAVRARPARSAWPRWLWAAPVAAASLAVVVAVSVRVGDRPPSASREDPNALLGESPYASAPAAAPQAAPADAGAPPEAVGAGDLAAKGALAEGAERPLAKKAEAPRRDEAARARFATAPEAAPSPRPSPPLRGGEGELRQAPAAPAPRPSPPLRGGEGGARSDREQDVGAFASAPAAPPPAAREPEAPAPRAAGSGRAAPQPVPPRSEPAGSAATREREAAPARRAAKAMAAPEARDEASDRARALAAARTRATLLGFDTGGVTVDVGAAPVTWEELRAERPGTSAAPPAALAGRRFWVVVFLPAPGAGGDLTVFVEDGTFRALAELRGK